MDDHLYARRAMERPDECVAEWAEGVIGPFRILSRFAHEHGNAALWRLEASDGRVWLKMHARRASWASEAHALKAWGPLVGRTPRLLAAREAILIAEIAGIPAKSLGWEGAAADRLWREAGAWLARLHALPNDWFGSFESDGTPVDAPEEDAVAFQGAHWDDVLAQARASGLFDAAELSFAARRAREGLEALAGERPCATHRDFSPRNWLARPDGELAGVIDFEHARWDARAADLCLPYDRDFPRNPRLEATFLDGYGGLDDRLRAQVAAFRAMLALRRAAWSIGVGGQEFARENVEALRRQMRD